MKAERGTALLVDGDNLPPSMLEPLLAMLERDGPVPERKVFRNWRSSRDATSWDEACRRFGFERMDRYRAASDKNASDIAVVVSAMDLLHDGYRSFCIASGDTDFAPLVERLRRGGCHIVLVGHKADGGILEELADRYMPWTALTNAGRPARKALPSRTTESPRPKGAAPPPKQRSNPSRAAKQAKAARPARPEPKPPARAEPARPAARKAAVAKPARPQPGGEHELEGLLRDAFQVALTDGDVDEDGWAPVDRLGMHLQSLDADFSPRQYGLGARTPLGTIFERFGKTFEVRRRRKGRQNLIDVRLRGL